MAKSQAQQQGSFIFNTVRAKNNKNNKNLTTSQHWLIQRGWYRDWLVRQTTKRTVPRAAQPKKKKKRDKRAKTFTYDLWMYLEPILVAFLILDKIVKNMELQQILMQMQNEHNIFDHTFLLQKEHLRKNPMTTHQKK